MSHAVTRGFPSLFVVSALLGSGAGLAQSAPALTAADYARAERFLDSNKDKYVTNGELQPHWIGKDDRFWYTRTNAAGEKRFVVTNASSGLQTPAFDQQKIADALAQATQKRVDAGRLPFNTFRYTKNNAAIEFEHEDKLFTCQLKASGCTSGPKKVGDESVSPDGKWAAILKDWNLFVRPGAGGEPIALTTDGEQYYSYAGSPGYNLHFVTDLRNPKPTPPQVVWSPNSRYLLTHRLDERKVKDFWLLQSVPEDGSVRPKLYTYRYAMSGDENLPLWEPILIDLQTRKAIKVQTEPLVSSVNTPTEMRYVWWSADSKKLYYLNRDRFSKSISLNKVDPATGAVTEVMHETSDTVVQTNANNVFGVPSVHTLKNGDVIWFSPRDGWGHLYYYNDAGALRNQITKGEWLVRDLVRVDERGKKIYFAASGRESGRDPYEQRLYSIGFDGNGMKLLTPEEAEHEIRGPSSMRSLDAAVEMEESSFSPSGKYFVDTYSRVDKPPVHVLRGSDGRLIKQLEQADISKLKEGGYKPIEPFKVVAADGNTEVYGSILRPSNFDPNKKYPIVDANYPGPQVKRTAKDFMGAVFDREEAQAIAELGFIVITIDGRGTPHRSRAFTDYSYGRLDKASELEDHLSGIRQLAKRYPFMDLDRVGIYGISGGGFRAAQAILAYPDFYKVAISAEGNHDQMGYLAPWAETYVGPVGERNYAASATPPLAGNLKGKLFLMHGEMDDNVSPTLTMKLVDALIKANKDFDLLIIPNTNHGTAFKSNYYIRRKWDYLVRNLLGVEPPADYQIK